MTILATIVLLGVLIFVHELGHFWAAKAVGVGVERFSIGLGPRIWGFERGDTEYVLSAIPLGGYVKMQGMEDEVMEHLEGGPSDGPRRPPAGRLRRPSHLGPRLRDLGGRRHEHALRAGPLHLGGRLLGLPGHRHDPRHGGGRDVAPGRNRGARGRGAGGRDRAHRVGRARAVGRCAARLRRRASGPADGRDRRSVRALRHRGARGPARAGRAGGRAPVLGRSRSWVASRRELPRTTRPFRPGTG